MWGNRVLGILCLLLFAIQVDATSDEIRLKVTVRKEALQRVSSCVHAFSQVELLNLDETEPIVIHSVDLEGEEMKNPNGKETIQDGGVPQQLYVSTMSEITLGPKQEAIIPMTFVPRFPSAEEPSPDGNTLRNNLEYQVEQQEFQVQTHVVLDTSRGVLRVPIEASSLRQNGFRLPDTIYFPEETSITAESDAPDCFDVHLSNPAVEYPLLLFDVVVSRPDLVKMYYKQEEFSDAALSKMLKDWQGSGEQRSIPPKVKDEYVVTLCPRREGESVPEAGLRQKGGLSRLSDLNDGLGYLQIRTDKAVLVVNLKQTEGNNGNVKDIIDGKECKKESTPQDCRVQDKVEEVPSVNKKSEQPVQSHSTGTQIMTAPNNSTLSMMSTPELEVYLIPYVNPKFEKAIELRNMSRNPVRVIESSLVTSFQDSLSEQAAKDVGLQLQTKIAKRNLAATSNDPHLLDDVVILTCLVSSSSPLLQWNTKIKFSGLVTVRATADQNISYEEWKIKLEKDPSLDSTLTWVFPFAVNVMDRKVHVALEWSSYDVPSTWKQLTVQPDGVPTLTGLFYPINRSDGRPRDFSDRSNVEPIPEEIEYSIMVLSPIGKPLEQAKIEVVNTLDGEGKPKDSDLCRRFLLSNFRTFPSPERVQGSNLFHLGTAKLKYQFERVAGSKKKSFRSDGKRGLTMDSEAAVPTPCYLQVLTDSTDGGLLTVPILLYPGKLDAASSEYEMPSVEKDSSDQMVASTSSIISGFDNILQSLRSSNMGPAVKKVLKSIFGGRTNDGPSMLAIYMAGLATRSLSLAGNTLRPILLNVGSIVHDEVQSFPLYLTNHNPVPIGVSIDVGEVEGMSILLGREVSHGKGDGNGLLDRLPKTGKVKDETVTSGRWEGHSKRGLHKFLLTSSEFPQTVSSNLRYRDDISPSPVAAEVHPILQSLYKEYDVDYFHAEAVPPVAYNPKDSACPSLDLDPPGYSDEKKSLNDSYPFIISDSLSIKRRLSTCRDSKNATMSLDSRVSIPPGGVARFEIKVRCPSREALDSDITKFLASGLVLSTDYGQVMPIFASFEALLGHLQLSTAPSSEASVVAGSDSYADTIIDVSPELFFSNPHSRDVSLNETKSVPGLNNREIDDNTSVPIFITSSFTREVAMHNVESCNPWFGVELVGGKGPKNETPTVVFGEQLEIGSVRSTIPCNPFLGGKDFPIDFPEGLPGFPSFFDCASDWLQNRGKLQSRDCGLPLVSNEGSTSGKNAVGDDVLNLAREASRNVLRYSLVRFNEGFPRSKKPSNSNLERSSRSSDPDKLASVASSERGTRAVLYRGWRPPSSYITLSTVDLFAQMNYAWNLVKEAGLNIVSTHLRAEIDYSADSEGNSKHQRYTALDRKKSQSLTVAMREVVIRTSLEMPTVLDHRESNEHVSEANDALPVIQFPPTRIGDVSSLTVPVHNPTSVPIRVRLGGFAKTDDYSVDGVYDDVDFRVVSADVRDKYLHGYSPVYVQNEDMKDQPVRGDSQYWWEGGGAYILPDDHGDVIQARYSLSITAAGSNAHVSVVNPSLQTINGLSIGCGTRCGVKEDSQKTIPALKYTSPIGASSAAGSTLVGQARPRHGPLDPGSLHISAGGSFSSEPAHLPFAIPYSSQDEIVVPPYGVGELGPILFRPPGRHSTLGCSTEVESQGNHSSTRSECRTNAFESLIFLENSLTGLERVVVRGEGTWESVAILDPDPTDDSPFGDLEYRYGRSTLVFPGSSLLVSSLRVASLVRKEVVVQNNGDVRIEYGRASLSEAPDLGRNAPVFPSSHQPRRRKKGELQLEDGVASSHCQMRGFKLIGCSESDDLEVKVNGQEVINVWNGFALDPGQKVSLVVEHYPDCSFSSEYIALNLDVREETTNNSTWAPGPMPSRHTPPSQRQVYSKAHKTQILVGYEMSAAEMACCIPLASSAQWDKSDKRLQPLSVLSLLNVTEWRYFSEKQNSRIKGIAVSLSRLTIAFLSLFVIANATKGILVRDTACTYFQSSLRGVNVNGSSSNDVSPHISETDWSAAFRCLARVDPLSSELQAVGREQARQLVLDRYKSIGAITPQCISSAGILQRDRSGVVGAGGTVMSGGEKRSMTLSDVMFRGAFTDQGGDSEIDRLFPCSLGWRAASTKGLVRKLSHVSKSKELLAKRKALLASSSERIPEELQSERGYERSSADRAIPNTHEDIQIAGDDSEDIVSTSESEGTDSDREEEEVEAESPRGMESVAEEEDFTGFAKVRQKVRGGARDKKKTELKVAGLAKEKPRKETLRDSPQVLVYKKEANTNAKASTTANVKDTKKQAPVVHSGSNDVLVPQKNKQAQKKVVDSKVAAKVKTTKKPTVPPAPKVERTPGIVNSPIGTRSISSVASSTHSSPSSSSVGQVSVSSRSTSRTDDRMSRRHQANKGRTKDLRPPPGLAPPPGFGSDGSESLLRAGSDEILPPVVPNLAPEPSLPLGSNTDFPPLSGSDTSAPAPSTSIFTTSDRSPGVASSPVLTSASPVLTSKMSLPSAEINSGFDVMDFLDNILGDQEPLPVEGESLGELLTKETGSVGSAMPVSSDPWATERKSRASAYGIHVEDAVANAEEDIVYAMMSSAVPSNQTNGENSSSLHNSVPLLTPSLLAANQGGDGGEESTPLFRRGSFYSSLLQEE